MDMVYMKLYWDDLDALETLSDSERGRLMTAILQYGRGEETKQLTGGERTLFPIFRNRIDRDRAALRAEEDEAHEKKVEAGRKGGLSKASKASKSKQMLANASKPSINNNNNTKDKNDNKEQKTNTGDIGAGAPAKRPRFIPPTAWDVQAYCDEHGYKIDAQRFVDYYERQGWRLSNGQPVASWQACIRTWVQRDEERKTAQPGSGNVFAEIAKEMEGVG